MNEPASFVNVSQKRKHDAIEAPETQAAKKVKKMGDSSGKEPVEKAPTKHEATEHALLDDETIKDTTENQPAMSPLLALPAELRNKIYELVVVRQKSIRLDMNQRFFDRPAAEQPALSKVSRQLRVEILPLFYGMNTFELYTWGTYPSYWLEAGLKLWVKYLGTHNCALVKNFVLFVIADKADCKRSLTSKEKQQGIKLRRSARVEIGPVLADRGVDFRLELYWLACPHPRDDQAFQSALAEDLGHPFEKSYFLRKRRDRT